jgi:hypothetical protein
MKKNKYKYLYVLQGYYSYCWEDLTASESLTEVKQNKNEYHDNERGTYRIIKRRELNV